MFVAPNTRNRKKLTFLRLSVSQMLNTDFGKADLILGQKFGQDHANGLWRHDDPLVHVPRCRIG